MTDVRAADEMYEATSPAPPAPPPPPVAAKADAPSAPTGRAADDMYSASPAPVDRSPRVVAKADAAKSAGEVMWGVDSTPRDAPADAAPADPAGENADAPPQEFDLIEVAPDIAVSIPRDLFESYDQSALDALAPVIEKHGLEGEAVQELFDVHLTHIARTTDTALNAYHAELAAGHEATLKEWRAQIDKDPELRAFGIDNVRSATKGVLDQYFDEEAAETLRAYGLANHPGILKGLLRMQEAQTHRQATSQGYKYKHRIAPLSRKPGKGK